MSFLSHSLAFVYRLPLSAVIGSWPGLGAGCFAIGASIIPILAGDPAIRAAITFGLIFIPAVLIDIARATRSKARPAGGGPIARAIQSCSHLPYAMRFMTITFVLTCLFSFERRFDVVPNSLGLFELLTPVILSAILFDLSGGLFCAALAICFGFFAFAPPRFAGIFDLDPSFPQALAGFACLSLCCSIYFSRTAEALLARSDRVTDREVAERLWLSLRLAATRLPSLVRPETLIICSLVLAYGLFWATYAQVSSSAGVHIDSLEAYAWGREFRLGYYKHPPFWAWVAGLWFMVLPKTDWCFWLLSELNGALGLAGAYALMGRFCGQRMRLIGVFLLMLTPFYQFNALRFNANTILLSIWPWTMYFFVRSIETRRLGYALGCGVLAGFALLSKYFGLVLIGSCFVASLTHHNRRTYFASASPYISLLIAGALFTPHAIWLFRDGFQPLTYMATKIDLRDRAISDSFFEFIGASFAFFVAPMALLLLARWRGGASARTPMPAPENGRSFENVIAFSPFILTLIAGSVGHTALAIPFGVPIFSLAALPLLRLINPPEDKALAYVRGAVLALMAACAMAAPFMPSIFIGLKHKDHIHPHAEAAQAAIALWREKTGAPLHFASGDRMNSLSITFRSGEDTSEFNGFNTRWSPAATPDMLRRHGLLVLCTDGSSPCFNRVGPFLTTRSIRHEIMVAHPMAGSPVMGYTVFIIPPEPE